jgi:membrane protein
VSEGNSPIPARQASTKVNFEDAIVRERKALVEEGDKVKERLDSSLDEHPRLSRLIRLIRKTISEQSSQQLGLAASGAAFWLVISLLPLASAVISIFGLILSPHEVSRDVESLVRLVPGSLGKTISTQLLKVASSDPTGVSLGLAASLLLTLWSVSAGVYNLDRAIRTAYCLRRMTYIRARTRAFVGGFAGVLLFGIIAMSAGTASFSFKDVSHGLNILWGVPAFLIVIWGTICGLYRFSIGTRVGFRHLFPGAAVSVVVIVVLVSAFGLYLHFSTHYVVIYGFLAGVVIAMVATYLITYVILLGAVLNTQIAAETSKS